MEVGGVERGVVDLARAMKKLGHETVVISSGGQLVGELEKMNVQHYVLPVHKKSLTSLALVSGIARVIERERVDIVHGRSRVPAWLGWLAARRAGVPFVTTCHGYYSNHMLSKIMGWGKRVIVISRIIGRHMIDDFGVAPDRIRLIHRGVDLTQFTYRPRAAAASKSGAPQVKRIINVGRFSPIKGQVEFLKAVHRVRCELGPIEVMLVGSEGGRKQKYTQEIMATIRQLGLESCVKLMGTRRDIPALLAQSDLLVLSTLVPEAFGRVVVEAGAVGTPVVATRVGGVLDIIDEGENGLLVPPGDVEAMASSITRLLRDPQLAAQFSARLRQKVETQFTVERMTQSTLAVYEEVRKEKKILVIKLGAMGDLILAVPSLRMLRERFPGASISLLVDKKIAPLVSGCPYVQEIIPVERGKLSGLPSLLKLAKRLRRQGFEISVDLQNSKWTHLLAFLAGVPERYGFERGSFGFILNRPVPYERKPEPPVRNQFRILSKLGVRKLDEHLELWPEPEAVRRAAEQLGENGQDRRPAVGLVLGSSPNWPTKRWPAASFHELARRLADKAGCRVLLFGAREDAHLLSGFAAATENPHIVNLIGKTGLAELSALIKGLDVMVTGDTGPLHIAGAHGTRIVALFGPTDPRRHMPPGGTPIVISRALSCQPCYSGACKNKEVMACLNQISVDEVYQSVLKQMGHSKSAPPSRKGEKVGA